MAAGQTSRYGATIDQIAEDSDHPYHPLALLALDGQETQPELALWLRNGSLTGLQEVVCTLHVPWSRKTYSYRALARVARVTPWAVAKYYAAGLARLRTAERPPRELCDDERLWRRWEDWRRLQCSPWGRDDGGHAKPSRKGTVVVRPGAKGTRWPAERWQPPGDYGEKYGKATMLPRDADAGRDVLAKERRRAARRPMVDTSAAIEVEGTVEARPPSLLPCRARRAHLSVVHTPQPWRRPPTEKAKADI